MRIFLPTLALLLLLTSAAFASAPTLISYQGYLADDMGDPLTGSFSIAFSIWDAESGGTQLWTETHATVAVDAGAFNVILGSTTPVTADLFADSVRYLQISVGGDVITPRSRLVSVPYAHHVSTLDGASAGVIEGPLVISPSDFDSLGNGIVVLNNNGNPQLIVTIGSDDVASVSIIEPEDSKANGRAVGSKIAELNRDGLTLFGATEADTTAEVRPDGSINARKTISVGENNTNPGDFANVIGFNNSADGDSATVSGGYGNTASGNVATISGGAGNTASGGGAVVGGGSSNGAATNLSVIGGGSSNGVGASGTWGVIAGGEANMVSQLFGSIGGGQSNVVSSSGGVVGGGYFNTASGAGGSTVAGGSSNTASGSASFVGGGSSNDATGTSTTLAGGTNNYASATGATVGGGVQDSANGNYSTVSGGYTNKATTSYATVPGGLSNKANGLVSFAAGNNATANHDFSFVWGDGSAGTSSTADNQFTISATNGVNIIRQAGESKTIGIGERYKDNSIVAWAIVNGAGVIQDEFGIESVTRNSAGNYTIVMDSSPTKVCVTATPEIDSHPTSASAARLVSVNITGTDDTIELYITNGSYSAVDNDFMIIVTGR